MEIAIVAAGLPFGPTTLKHRSLGGSETAVINVAHALRKRGHMVAVYCNLPQEGPDVVQPGTTDELGVRWHLIQDFPAVIGGSEVDLLIASRSPELLNVPHQAKKAVLWCHDLAVHRATTPALMGVGWNLDEIWTVSEFHRQQYAKVTGFPLANIRATRNGITEVDVMDMGDRIPNQLFYAARPERGLEYLVKPGGIMSMLPEFQLVVSMYDNFPQQMQGYYQQLNQWAQALPNVKSLGCLTQQQVRQTMRNSLAYVYPTRFEEVSCILAREAMEQRLPFVTTGAGALPETLGACGIYVDGDPDSREFKEAFCREVRKLQSDKAHYARIQGLMAARDDLYWDGVAEQWENWGKPQAGSDYSRIWSLIEDSDILPAMALAEATKETGDGIAWLKKQLDEMYPHVHGRESFASYYERYYRELEDKKEGARVKPDRIPGLPRYQAIAKHVASLPPGSTVLDYGCAEGVNINNLAKQFPHIHFVGVDFAQSNLDLAAKFAAQDGITNVEYHCGHTGDWPKALHDEETGEHRRFDAIICSEVLEHVVEPWELADYLERYCGKQGGKFIATVPSGPWEASGLYNRQHWPWRAHIWHIDKWMIRQMTKDKKGRSLNYQFCGHQPDGRALGHLIFAWDVDHNTVIHEVDPLEKAKLHRARQTCGAAIIARNSAATILRTLQSLGREVQQLHVAVGPSEDRTRQIIEEWANDTPWVQTTIVDVPGVQAQVFGFDDARNKSIARLNSDWVLWIDTDEYLSGSFQKYIRANAFDSYAIHQHHFSCDPRGAGAQLDKPARLFRRIPEFKFFGKVHEHAEKGYNGGPGFCFILPDIDIGHPGYVNEEVRRKRFFRNFPLLEWDHKLNPDRRLGHYLWLRDILHRMRFHIEQRDAHGARLLAEEAVQYYRGNWKSFDEFGMGGMNAYAYYSEALAFLGRGINLQLQVKLDANDQNGPVMAMGGTFESADEIAQALKLALDPEFKKRASGYY